MGDLEFVTTEETGAPRVISLPGATFTLGADPAADVPFPAELTDGGSVEVHVDAGQLLAIARGHTSMEIDGAPTVRGLLVAGQVLRIGRLGLYVRQASLHRPSGIASTQITPVEDLHATSEGVTETTAVSKGLRPGFVVGGRYEIVSRLAMGGMGEVYKAEHVELRRPFALKTMRLDLSHDADFVARFKREAIACSRIGQQNIIDVSDFGQTDQGQFYFVMEYLDGETLASVIHSGGAMPVVRVVRVALQVARALAAAHDQGVIHRDIKPENIMLLQRPGQADFVKVLDFGVAKVAQPDGAPQAGQTRVGMVVGTPQYMSPEQAVGQLADARTDIYALGLVLHEMVTGRVTFSAPSIPDLIFAQISTPAPALGTGPFGDLPAELADLVATMLAKSPGDRPADLEQVVEVLERLAAELAAPLRPPRQAWSERGSTLEFPPPPEGPESTVPLQRGSPVAEARRVALGEDPAPATLADAAALPPDQAEPPVRLEASRAPLIAGLVAGVAVLGAVAWWALQPAAEPPRAPVVAVAVAAPPSPTPPEPVAPEPVVVVPPPTPAAPAAPAQFELELVSTPPGAQVLEGTTPLGQAPLRLSREAGSRATLLVQLAGYQPQQVAVAFVGDPRRTVTLVRTRPSAPARAPGPDIKNPFPDAPESDIKNPF